MRAYTGAGKQSISFTIERRSMKPYSNPHIFKRSVFHQHFSHVHLSSLCLSACTATERTIKAIAHTTAVLLGQILQLSHDTHRKIFLCRQHNKYSLFCKFDSSGFFCLMVYRYLSILKYRQIICSWCAADLDESIHTP